jgi:endonuclease YncB( thermonuclease family)
LLETCRKVIAEYLSELIDATGLRRGASEFYLYSLLLVVLLLTLCFPWNSYVACFTGPVFSVPDGDTIEILHGDNPERIRLDGIGLPGKGPLS